LSEPNNKILADTCIWIEFFRPESAIGTSLAELLKQGLIASCGIVLFELLQGIRSEPEKGVIQNTLSGLPYFEMTTDLWEKAAGLATQVKRRGLNLPLSDIFIAAIAIEHKLPIFTLDKHFEQIPGVQIYNP
jgi:predicted nucleic acid-binding protein